jgi:hypothetical protein
MHLVVATVTRLSLETVMQRLQAIVIQAQEFFAALDLLLEIVILLPVLEVSPLGTV